MDIASAFIRFYNQIILIRSGREITGIDPEP